MNPESDELHANQEQKESSEQVLASLTMPYAETSCDLSQVQSREDFPGVPRPTDAKAPTETDQQEGRAM